MTPNHEDDAGEGRGSRARGPSPSEPMALEPRTLRGLAFALSMAAVGIFFYHGLRPWLAHHQIPTHVPDDLAGAFKATLGFAGFGASLWLLLRRLGGRPIARKKFDALLVLLATLGVIAFAVVDDLRAESYVHRWEFFHYYLGSKYSNELGYTRLYRCAAVAQAEANPSQRAEVAARSIRNLETNGMEPAAPLLDAPEACTSRFTPERWTAFKADVAWFRYEAGHGLFDRFQRDHGYNPPPVWTMGGKIVGSIAPVANRTTLSVLSSIGPIVYALTFFSIWWAFGLRTCCLALIFWGAQFPAYAFFTGGAFLREDWLLLLVLSACLLRKRYWALAGAALAWSALLRVFPAVFFAGLVVVAGAHYLRHRRFDARHLRVFAGAGAATVVLVALSVLVVGARAYPEFVEHIRLHGRTAFSNSVGLPQIISFTSSGDAASSLGLADDPGAVKWATAHEAALARRWPIHWACTALVAAAFVWTVRRIKTLWIALALGVVLVVSVQSLACYYYSFFLVAALLAKASPRAGRGMLFAAGLSSLLIVWPRVSGQWPERYTAQSLVFVGLAWLLLAGFARRSRPSGTTSAAVSG